MRRDFFAQQRQIMAQVEEQLARMRHRRRRRFRPPGGMPTRSTPKP